MISDTYPKYHHRASYLGVEEHSHVVMQKWVSRSKLRETIAQLTASSVPSAASPMVALL